MQDTLYVSLCGATLLTTAMMAGIYFIFSNTIMPALAQLAPESGAVAMQRINRVILNPGFFLLFFGSALLSLTLLLASWFIADTDIPYGVCAAILVLVSFLVTVFFNVPLNNALDQAPLTQEVGIEVWQRYLSEWVMWNHVRTVATTIATALFVFQFILIVK